MNKSAPVLAGKDSCTGCGLCAAVCPKSAIHMEYDKEGFLFPSIGNDCIGCHTCEKFCPVFNPIKWVGSPSEQNACCAIHKNDKVWRDSSSGGAFSAICQIFGDSETKIFGAIYDKYTKTIHHDYVTGVENIAAFRGSKYVQSDLKNSFKQVQEFLSDGKKVIFSGVSCQVAALRKFLGGTTHKNLLCIDVVCMGTGSPKVFKDYLEMIERQENGKVYHYKSRQKRIKYGVQSLYIIDIEFMDKHHYVNEDDPYIELFLRKILCRRCCNKCMYTNLRRMGDITLSDFKQMYTVIKSAPANRNGSAVICNTSLGRAIFDRLSEYMTIYPCHVEDIVKTVIPLSKCTPSPKEREIFFSDYINNIPMEKIMEKYHRKKSMRTIISEKLPNKLKERLKYILGAVQ